MNRKVAIVGHSHVTHMENCFHSGRSALLEPLEYKTFGRPGAVTTNLLTPALITELTTYGPSITILFIGSNDLDVPGDDPNLVNSIHTNILGLVEGLRTVNNSEVFVMLIEIRKTPSRTSAENYQKRKKCLNKKLKRDTRVRVIPTLLTECDLARDGIHFHHKSYRALAQRICVESSKYVKSKGQ